jgi:hypothetical protein
VFRQPKLVPQPPQSIIRKLLDAHRILGLDANGVGVHRRSPDFSPDHNEAVAPGFAANGDEVQQAAKALYEALKEVVPSDSEEGEDWATVPVLAPSADVCGGGRDT